MTAPPNYSAPPVLVQVVGNDTTTCIVSLMATMPIDHVDRFFARYGGANALRQYRLDRRDAAIRELVEYYDLTGSRPFARAIRTDLVRLAASGNRHDRSESASASKRSALRRVLDLVGDGKIPGVTQMRTILAGVR